MSIHQKRSIRAIAVAAFCTWCVAGSLPAVALPHSGPITGVRSTFRHAGPGTASGGHLYLSAPLPTSVFATIYEYPLTNGIPAQSPDNTLSTKLFNVEGVAIGPDGDLYVSGTKVRNHQELPWIDVWSPGATGTQAPVRFLDGIGGTGVAVDANDYLYAYSSIYAPGAQGKAKPVQVLKAPRGEFFVSVAVGPQNDAYLDGGTSAFVYANPVNDPHRIDSFCWRPKYAASYAIAVGSDGTAYVGGNDYDLHHTAYPGQIFVFPPGTKGCNPARSITTTDEPLNIIDGLVAAGPYLYALDYGGSLVVLDPTKGAQAPIARIGTGYEASGLAIGP
jgi:hypothetical protein